MITYLTYLGRQVAAIVIRRKRTTLLQYLSVRVRR
jgi:hypothetical protein